MIGELAALGAAISWAIAPIMYKKALVNARPISANIVRCATNAAVLAFLLFAMGLTGVLGSLPLWAILATIISGIIGLGLGDTLYMTGLKTIGVSRSVPLASTYPLFGLIWAVLLLNEIPSALAICGAVIILIGIWLISRQQSGEQTNISRRTLLVGVTFSLITAVIWSVSITLMDIVISKGASTLAANYSITTVRITSIACFLMIASPFVDKTRGFLKISKKGVVLLCIGGLIANGLGWVLMNYSFLNIPEAQAITISSTSPLFAAFAGYLLFREKATIWSILGAVTIVAGIVLIFIV